MPRTTLRAARLSLVLLAGIATAGPGLAQNGLAGSYLAGRQAATGYDFEAAASYFTRAIVRDPENPMLMENAVIALISKGDLDTALPIARRLRQLAPDDIFAELVILADQLRAESYEEVLAEFADRRDVGPLVDGLIEAWTHLALGDMSAALATFDRVKQNENLAPFAAYHQAFALALVGDAEGAERLFAGEGDVAFGATRRGVMAHAQVLSQLERFDEALELLDRTLGAEPFPGVEALRARLMAREPAPFDLIASPRDGMAEVFLTVAGALNGEAEDGYTLLYSRIAEALSPGLTDAVLLSAGILERVGQYDLATQAYNSIPPEDPAYYLAELGRAEALDSAGSTDAAIEALRQLAKAYPHLPDVHRTLGDTLHRQARYAEASAAYDAAIAALPSEADADWFLYFMRGITNERSGQWAKAEADFLKALELAPDQPSVLNYLGYSYLEKNTNLDEALDMIQRAVDQRPEDGAIVDSLGWALFRLNRYQEAVEPMEAAVALLPVDPVVNDHLGDVLWAVGRKLEARFQWRRALSFITPQETQDIDPDRIRRKLEIGLDAVLEEEGAEPLAVADDRGG